MKKSFIFLFFFLPVSVFGVDCGGLKVKAVQSQKANVLIQVSGQGGTYWKNLGSHGSDSIKSYQSIAQQALATGDSIVLRFPSGYDCNTTDYGTVPDMIRIVKF